MRYTARMIPGRMVLLEHTLPDGEVHFDWLIYRPSAQGVGVAGEVGEARKPIDPEARELLSFRVMKRIDRPAARRFAAERMENHRNLYLAYSGEVSGGRGSVRTVARGLVVQVEEMDGAIAIRALFARASPYLWAGSAGVDGWTFQRGLKLAPLRVEKASADAGFASWHLGDASSNSIGLASDWLSGL